MDFENLLFMCLKHKITDNFLKIYSMIQKTRERKKEKKKEKVNYFLMHC